MKNVRTISEPKKQLWICQVASNCQSSSSYKQSLLAQTTVSRSICGLSFLHNSNSEDLLLKSDSLLPIEVENKVVLSNYLRGEKDEEKTEIYKTVLY